jgi:hypothetical protein
VSSGIAGVGVGRTMADASTEWSYPGSSLGGEGRVGGVLEVSLSGWYRVRVWVMVWRVVGSLGWFGHRYGSAGLMSEVSLMSLVVSHRLPCW